MEHNMAARKFLLINGPNLDMLGTREPEVYGSETLVTLEQTVRMYTEQHGALLTCFQSNSEAKLINKIHSAAGKFDGIVYNPGAHTHYSIALRDAVASISVPVVEVHLSDVDARESFRHISVIAPVCIAQVKGLGVGGYCRAIDILLANVGLKRLGEGYEKNFAEGANIRVAGKEKNANDDAVAKLLNAVKSAGTVKPAAQPAVAPQPEVAPQAAVPQSEVVAQPAVVAQPQVAAQPAVAPQQAAVAQPAVTQQSAVAVQPTVAQQPTAVAQPAAVAQSTVAAQPAVVAQPAVAPQPEAVAQPAAVVAQTTPLAQSVEAPVKTEPEKPVDLAAGFPNPSYGSLPSADMGLISARRQAAVCSTCNRLGLSALLIRDTPSIRWITGFDNVFDEERAHALAVSPAGVSLHTDSRYSNALYTAASSIGSGVSIDESRINHFTFAHQLLAPGTNGAFEGKLGIEDTISYAEFVKAVESFGSGHLAPTNDVILSLRAVKDENELARMRAAQAVTDAAFEYIIRFMRPGMTEREVQVELDNFMASHGAEALAFSSIVACGENGADPHAIPGDKKLEAGQCVVMDFGARVAGYCADMTRTVFLGAPQGKMAQAWDVLRQANETVERALRPGVTGRQAHEMAEQVLAQGGFAGRMGHGLGHGVGLECHELPVLNARNDSPLVEGNVVTVEPGIYLPGEFGMRLEDCGVITAQGYQPFSRLGHEMVVL